MMKHIRQNIWGNWNGYEGKRKVIEFGTDEFAARDWLQEPLADADAAEAIEQLERANEGEIG